MKSLDKVRQTANLLNAAGIESAEREAELFITAGLGIDLITLYKDDPEIKNDQMSAIDGMVKRRLRREPLQYILGTVDFLGLKLMVGPGILIPRPETELMAEYAMNRVKSQESRVKGHSANSKLITLNSIKNSELRILDLCTGSGCLALAFAKEFPDAEVFGVDISKTAINYARNNADLNNVHNAKFLAGDLFNVFTSSLPHYSHFFDIIISNPPYIKSDEIKTLQPEVREWEPLHALDGGRDGLDFYRAIIPDARQFLKKDGLLMLELGIDCTDGVRVQLQESGYSQIEIIKDYAGIERIISARK